MSAEAEPQASKPASPSILVTFRGSDGNNQAVAAKPGASVMQAATQQGVEGIIAQCGGSCACGTCHVILSPQDLGRFPAPDDMEDSMLDCVAAGRTPTSRLGCQLVLTVAHDGLVLELPETQV